MMSRILSILLLLFSLVSRGETIDFTHIQGPVKPVNGVGQPPLGQWGVDVRLFHYLGEAGIPYSRLHDVGGAFGRNLFVDVPNIFRDFSANENKAENYDFTFTDSLLNSLVRQGVEPYYRLGVTIENYCTVQAVRIFPPKDYAKWARICEHIIRHYNEGWANGYHMNISHWEIWNEPDNGENPMRNPMWRSTFDEFIKFYGVVAPYLKKRFPHLLIGGYGSCGFYAVNDQGVVAANAAPYKVYYIKCFLKFLSEAHAHSWPLDFFSCHSYAVPSEALLQFAYARKKLDEYGFHDTELSVNEWLPGPDHSKLGTALQAAEIAAELIGFQNGPVDNAEIYDARATGDNYGPLFNPSTGKPYKAYYVFRAFHELRRLGKAVSLPPLPQGIYAAGATDGKGRASLLVSNISGKSWCHDFHFAGMQIDSARVIDGSHTYLRLSLPDSLVNNSVWLLHLSANHPDPDVDLRVTRQVPPASRRVGIAYNISCNMDTWRDSSDTPSAGRYDSRDRRVIRRHAAQLSEAGVDFVWVDWATPFSSFCQSSTLVGDCLAQISDATDILFDEYRNLDRQGLPYPLVSFVISTQGITPSTLGDGSLQRKVDYVWERYAGNPRHSKFMERYLGKPLLIIRVDTPNLWPEGVPDWHDERFTIRWMTSDVSSQPSLCTPDHVSKYGYWSWKEHGAQPYSVFHGEPESMAITASLSGLPTSAATVVGRREGATLRSQFARAREIGVRYGMVVSWNEWTACEPESGKDFEPSVQGGDFYLKLLKEEIARFKSE